MPLLSSFFAIFAVWNLFVYCSETCLFFPYFFRITFLISYTESAFWLIFTLHCSFWLLFGHSRFGMTKNFLFPMNCSYFSWYRDIIDWSLTLLRIWSKLLLFIPMHLSELFTAFPPGEIVWPAAFRILFLRSGPVIYLIEELLQISPLLWLYHIPHTLLFPVPFVKNKWNFRGIRRCPAVLFRWRKTLYSNRHTGYGERTEQLFSLFSLFVTDDCRMHASASVYAYIGKSCTAVPLVPWQWTDGQLFPYVINLIFYSKQSSCTRICVRVYRKFNSTRPSVHSWKRRFYRVRNHSVFWINRAV